MSCEPWESGTPGRADPSARGDPPRSEGPATCVSVLCVSVPAVPSVGTLPPVLVGTLLDPEQFSSPD